MYIPLSVTVKTLRFAAVCLCVSKDESSVACVHNYATCRKDVRENEVIFSPLFLPMY